MYDIKIIKRALKFLNQYDYSFIKVSRKFEIKENIDYMKKNNIDYNIVKEYNNGVRVGNVPRHIDKKKQNGIQQSWFPKNWDRNKIKKAGQVVSRGTKLKDGQIKTGHYDNVNVGIIRINEKIATIFPMNIQKNKKGKL